MADLSKLIPKGFRLLTDDDLTQPGDKYCVESELRDGTKKVWAYVTEDTKPLIGIHAEKFCKEGSRAPYVVIRKSTEDQKKVAEYDFVFDVLDMI